MATRYVWNRYTLSTSYRPVYQWNRWYTVLKSELVRGSSVGNYVGSGLSNTFVFSSYYISNGQIVPTSYKQAADGLPGTDAQRYKWMVDNGIDGEPQPSPSCYGPANTPSPGSTWEGSSYDYYIDDAVYGMLEMYEYTPQTVTTKGNAAPAITSYNRNQYPDDGVSGSYWYEYSHSFNETVYSQGSLIGAISDEASNSYPNNTYSGSYWYKYSGSDTIDPASVSYDSEQVLTQQMSIQAAASTGNKYGGTITYDYQVCVDGSSWVDVGSSTALSMSYTIPETATQFQARVRARDNMGFTSSTWVTGPLATVRAPWVHHRLHLKNDQQVYDLVHFMTSAENVIHNNTSNVQATIDNIKQRLGLS